MGVCCRKSAFLGAVVFLVLLICQGSAGDASNTTSGEQPVEALKKAQEAEERSDADSNQGVDIPKDVSQDAERRMSLWDFFLSSNSNNNNNQRNANDLTHSLVQTQQPQTQIQQPNPNQVILVRNSAFPNPSGGLISRMLLARRMSRLQRIAARLQIIPLIMGLMQGSQLQQAQQTVPQQRQLLSQRIGRQQYREYKPSDILLDGLDFKNASSGSQRHFNNFENSQFFDDGGYQQNVGYQKGRDAAFFGPDDFPDPQRYYQAHSAYDSFRNQDQDDGLKLKHQDQSQESQRQLQQQQQIQLDKLKQQQQHQQQFQQEGQLQRQYPDQQIYEKQKQPAQIFDGQQQKQKDIFEKKPRVQVFDQPQQSFDQQQLLQTFDQQQLPQTFDQQQDQQKLQQQLLDYIQQLRQQQESQQQQQRQLTQQQERQQQLLDQQELLKQELFHQRQQQLQQIPVQQQQQQILQQPPVQQQHQQIFQQPPVQSQQQQQLFQQLPVQPQQQQQQIFQQPPVQQQILQQQPVQQQVFQQQIRDSNQFPDGSGKVAGDREGLIDLGASLNLGGGNGLQLNGGLVSPGVNVGTNIGPLRSLLTAAAPISTPAASVSVPLFPLGLLPKPMLNLNGRVIFGAELGKGVGLKTGTRR